MRISVTTRHFEAEEKIKKYLTEKLEKLQKFFAKIISARAILIKEGYRHIAEITLSTNSMQLVVKEAAEDMYSAVDLAFVKLQRRLVRFRDKVKEHKARRYKGKMAEVHKVEGNA
jgi:putative sigma-54 modulation protein